MSEPSPLVPMLPVLAARPTLWEISSCRPTAIPRRRSSRHGRAILMAHPPEPEKGEAAGEVDALDTVMKAAVLLQESGQSTSMTLMAVDRLNAGLGIRSSLIPSWTSLMLTSRR